MKLPYKNHITGRWERKTYRILKLLGQGGIGRVYLVADENGELRALKLSTDLVAITHEHRILRLLNDYPEIRCLNILPVVYELDDIQIGEQVYHFMVTQYCPGASLSGRGGRLGVRTIKIIGKQIAEFLEVLHRSGFVFGDLKPANVVYDFAHRNTYLVDFGSVCIKGQGVKQYTPGYDRASWQAGSRVADEQYDIFTLGILLTTLCLGKLQIKENSSLSGLVGTITAKVRDNSLREVVEKAVSQRITSCREIADGLAVMLEDSDDHSSKITRIFVNSLAAASVLAFILSLAYYYQ